MYFDWDYIFNILGYVGGFTLSICLTPQIYKTIRTKSTRDISYMWQLMYGLGIGLINIYSYHFKLYALLLPGLCEFTMIILLTFLKMCFEYRHVDTPLLNVINSPHSNLSNPLLESN